MKCLSALSLSVIYILGFSVKVDAQTAPRSTRVTPVVQAVQKALPTVVNLSTTKNFKIAQRALPFFRTPLDPLFSPFVYERDVQQTSLGSGVLIDDKGHVLTNYHVIALGGLEPADTISAFIYGEDEPRNALLLGGDPAEDIAVLQLEGDPPANYLSFGRSDDLMVGETVIAIGNALGNASTVTQGIISYVGRHIDDGQGHSLSGLIQTDADINPGNSGGPLININGELIGINTAISTTQGGGSIGLGFAIPVNRARQVYDYIVNRRLSLATRLGIRISNLEGDYKRIFTRHYPELAGDPRLPGVIVESVKDDGVMVKSIVPGAVITKLQGRRVKTVDDFALLESERNLTQIALEYFSRGEFKTDKFNVPPAESRIDEFVWNGMTIQEIDDYWRHRLLLNDNDRGLVIGAVKEKSNSTVAGLQPGDVLTSLGLPQNSPRSRIPIVTLDDLKAAIVQLAGARTIRVYFSRLEGNRVTSYRTDLEQ